MDQIKNDGTKVKKERLIQAEKNQKKACGMQK